MKHNIRVHAHNTNQSRLHLQGALTPWHPLWVTVIASSCTMVMRATGSTWGFTKSSTWRWAADPCRPTTRGKLWWSSWGFHLVWRFWFLATICYKTRHDYLQWEWINIIGSSILNVTVGLNPKLSDSAKRGILSILHYGFHKIKGFLKK